MSFQNYEIIDKFQEKLLIKCSICGRIDIINCAELQNYKCATCNKFKVTDINKDNDELSRIIKTTAEDNSSGKIQLNRRYFTDTINSTKLNNEVKKLSNLYNILGAIYQVKRSRYNQDSQYTEFDSIACKCKNCNTTKLIKIEDNDSIAIYYCNNCKVGYNDRHNKDTLSIWNKLKGVVSDITDKAESKTHIKDSYNTKLLEKQRKEIKKTKKDESIHKIKIVAPNVSDKMQKAFDKIKELNQDLTIEGFTVNGAEYTVKCSCNRCGNDVSIASSLKKKQVDCEGCKKLNENPNYRGIYLRDNINNCKNNMVVTKDFGRRVEVSCILCSAKYTVNKYDWLYGNIYCDRDHDLLDATVICDNCKNYVVLRTSEIIKYKGDGTDVVICNCCKNPVVHITENGNKEQLTYGDIIAELSGTDSRVTRSRNFGLAIRELKSTTSTINSLCRSNQILYVNNNGERYYNCRCLEHNQNMILTDNEIDNFNHSQCEDVRNLIISDSMISNTTIK